MKPRTSRRSFLTGTGAGAAALVALGPNTALAARASALTSEEMDAFAALINGLRTDPLNLLSSSL